jgi:uncharacterized protein (DUF58 family)
MNLRLLTIVVLIVAAALRSAIFVYLLFVLVGLQLIAWLWVRAVARSVRWSRTVPQAAFPGEMVEVGIVVRNSGRLPIPWLLVSESVPAALGPSATIREVIALGAGAERRVGYTLQGRRRGLYRLGPLAMRTGDVLGLFEQQFAGEGADSLVIYPAVLPLPELGLPAALPFGERPAPGSLFTDPARPQGVRAYAPGDSQRQIDWKSSARVGALQVRRHEPAIARETLIALAFSRTEYAGRYPHDNLERGVVAAASIAAHLLERGQPVGLATSGHDPIADAPARTLAPAAGRPQLIEILRLLGRLEAPPEANLLALLDRASAALGWGSTVVVVACNGGEALVERLIGLRRRGLRPALLLVEGSAADVALAQRHQVATFLVNRAGIPVET